MRDALPLTYPEPRAIMIPEAVARRERGFCRALQTTIGVFVRHPLPVVACAFICFGGVGIVGSLVYGAMIVEAVIRTGSHTTTTMRAYNAQMLVQALIGAFTFLLGRGTLAWIALQEEHNDESVSLRAALWATLRAWRPLMLSTLLYGGLITLGLLGLSAMLRELRLDMSNTRSIRIGNYDNILNWTLIRAIALLPPDPGSPFSDWLASIRYNLAQSLVGSYLGFELATVPRAISPATIVVGLTSITGLVVVDGLLCLRTAAIFGAPAGQTWLQEALRVSSAHFARVLVWRWSLRLVFVAFAVAALVFIPVLHQVLVVGPVRQMLGTGYWPYHIAQSANGVGVALVNGLLIAASVIFEARMYKALAR